MLRNIDLLQDLIQNIDDTLLHTDVFPQSQYSLGLRAVHSVPRELPRQGVRFGYRASEEEN